MLFVSVFWSLLTVSKVSVVARCAAFVLPVVIKKAIQVISGGKVF